MFFASEGFIVGSTISKFNLYSLSAFTISNTLVFLRSGQFSLNVNPRIKALALTKEIFF